MNNTNIIIPDIPSDYMLDTDPWDSFYINQRYILYALFQAKNGEKTHITLYDIEESRSLIKILSNLFSFENIYIRWISKEYYKPTEEILGTQVDRSLYINTSGNKLETTLGKIPIDVKKEIINILNGDKTLLLLKSYKITKETKQIREYLTELFEEHNSDNQVILRGENDIEKIEKLGGKSFLHPNINGDYLFPLPDYITNMIPKGFFVSLDKGKEELPIALEKLARLGISKVAIKPVNASSGEGICFVNLENINEFTQDYDFRFGDIIVEEFVNLECMGNIGGLDNIECIKKDPLSISVQFIDGKIVGEPTIQLTHENEYIGNILIPSSDIERLGINPDMIANIKKVSHNLIKMFELDGSGGFDFLIDKEGNPYFIDPNLGRDTGALPSRLMEQLLNNPDKYIMFSKIPAKNIYNIEIFIEALEKIGINLFDNNNGILPITLINGEHCTMVIVGDNLEEVSGIYNKIVETATNNIYGTEKKQNRDILSNGEKIDYDLLHNLL